MSAGLESLMWLLVVILLYLFNRRLRRLEVQVDDQTHGPDLPAAELTLQAMIEQLEAKGREVAAQLERASEQAPTGWEPAPAPLRPMASASVADVSQPGLEGSRSDGSSMPSEAPRAPVPERRVQARAGAPAGESNTPAPALDDSDTSDTREGEDWTSRVHQHAGAILEMAKDGMTSEEMARTLGLGKGEVDLILNLNRKRLQVPPTPKP